MNLQWYIYWLLRKCGIYSLCMCTPPSVHECSFLRYDNWHKTECAHRHTHTHTLTHRHSKDILLQQHFTASPPYSATYLGHWRKSHWTEPPLSKTCSIFLPGIRRGLIMFFQFSIRIVDSTPWWVHCLARPSQPRQSNLVPNKNQLAWPHRNTTNLHVKVGHLFKQRGFGRSSPNCS